MSQGHWAGENKPLTRDQTNQGQQDKEEHQCAHDDNHDQS